MLAVQHGERTWGWPSAASQSSPRALGHPLSHSGIMVKEDEIMP